jgi:hypothetical protein
MYCASAAWLEKASRADVTAVTLAGRWMDHDRRRLLVAVVNKESLLVVALIKGI